ncbi:hypothetical protein [Rhizobium sp. CCGE532]|uniref:hypothetical protein n=1 Tax=unclassified Rhizobium TaxID=2613769 RepID=UPI0032AEAD56
MARFLWGEGDQANSLTNLRKLVSRIKGRQSDINAEFLTFDDTDIRLVQGSITSDIIPAHGDAPRSPLDSLALLAKGLQSKFLERANCQSRVFIDWRESERKRHRAMLKEALETAVKLPVAAGDVALVKEVALLVFEAEPQDENTHRILLRAFDVEGGLEQLRRIFSTSPASSRSSAPAIASHSAIGGAPEQDAATRTILRIPRLALLPPGNDGPDIGATLVASSLIEDITLGFCALHSLRVIAPYSAAQISRQSDKQLARFEHYDINYVLETRLSRPSGDLSLFAQLISLPSNEVIWAERFNFGKLDLVRNKGTISRQIVLAAAAEVERHEMTRAYFEQNPAAYHQYLVGQQYLHRLTLPDMRRARKELKAALHQSADFVPALSAIARTYTNEWLLTARGDNELLKSAEDFATRAISIRNDLSDGYRELGVAKLFQGSIDESVEALETAETLSPHHADVIADHADTLVHFSQPGPALEKIHHAMELNPINPDLYLWTAAGANYTLSRFQTALDYINQMADPSLADRLAAASWAMLGHQDEARMLVRRVRETNPDFDVDRWLSLIPTKEQWHKDLYREGLKKAGF